MGYSVITQEELNEIIFTPLEVNGVMYNGLIIHGELKPCEPRANNDDTLFIIQADQFTGYSLDGIKIYLQDNYSDWNKEVD